MALGDGPLQALAVSALRLVPESPEIRNQRCSAFDGIQALRAPGTASVPTVRVPEPGGKLAGREAVLHVGRNDGLAPRGGQPCQQVGKREGVRKRLAGDPGRLLRATAARELARDRRDRVLGAWRGIDAADGPEQPVETVAFDGSSQQCVPGQQQVAVLLLQRIDDVGKQLQRELGVQQRIADLHPRKRRLLVLLDQVVVRVLGERQRAQVERVNGREAEQRQVRCMFGEKTEIVFDDVVSDEARSAIGEGVELGKRRTQSASVSAPSVSGRGIDVYRANRTDVLATLKVDRK